jgi:uncharacterized NAD(P)/FAD-binding protein YdhS
MRIAVVGVGPRGTVMLERICANAGVLAPGRRVEVHLIDPYPPGGGRVWREDQDRSLLMNTVAGDITVFTDDTVTCEGPLRHGPTQFQWARMVAAGEITGVDPRAVEEAASLKPWSYGSRAFNGAYLGWAVKHIVETAPPEVSIVFHETRAIGLEDVAGGRQTLWLEHESEPLLVDAVVLSQGHFDIAASDAERDLSAFAEEHGLAYFPPASPGELDLSGIGAGEPVMLRGLGLNFFDYMILLTVGRGGEFGRDGERLVYRPSGREPVLYAGSGRGVPYTARAEIQQEIVPRYVATFLSAEVIAGLREHARTGRNDFMTHLWPYVAKEAGWVYCRHLLTHGDYANPVALERFLAEYPRLDWGAPEMTALLHEVVPDPAAHWDWAKLDKPAGGMRFETRDDYLSWIKGRLEHDYTHSKLGPAGSALKATAAMMRDLRDEVRQVISHQGLSGDSYLRDIERWFSGLNNFVASGPPASRVEELRALVEAGVIRFVGPGMRVVLGNREFVIDSPFVDEEPVRVGTLIEAHLPVTDVRRATDPLLRYLRESGQCRAHRIPNPDGGYAETGGLDIAEFTHRLVNADGEAHRGRFSYGPPVESVQWVTAIGARPHVNSRTLLQGDVIARGALTAAAENSARSVQQVSNL